MRLSISLVSPELQRCWGIEGMKWLANMVEMETEVGKEVRRSCGTEGISLRLLHTHFVP